MQPTETVDDFGILSSMLNQEVRSEDCDAADHPNTFAMYSGAVSVADPPNGNDQKQVQLTNYQNFFFASRPIPQTAELHNNARQRFDSVDKMSL